MSRGYSYFLALIALFFSTASLGQPWSGILAPDRAFSWANAGIPGGIPSRTTVCATINAGATTAAIQTAMNNCPTGQVVQFSAGTFNLSGNIYANKGIVLRGQGPNSTTLVLNGGNIFLGTVGNGALGGIPSTPDQTSWTGGLTRGSTVLTVGSTSGMVVGQPVIIDERNRPWVSTVGNAGGGGGNGRNDSPAGFYGSDTRAQAQMTKIVSVDSGTQITIRDPVAYTHAAAFTPQVFFWSQGGQPGHIQYAGVENLHIDANQNQHAIMLAHCDYCWAKNVWVEDVGRSAVTTRYGYGMVVRDSYFSSQLSGAPTQYGTECFMSSNVLVENNIIWNVTAPFLPQACFGYVVGYNYVHSTVAGNLFPSFTAHLSHNSFHLVEGNDIDKIQMDNVWGSSSHSTIYRNRANGMGENKSAYRQAIVLQAQNPYMNVVANVAGDTSFHNTYVCDEITASVTAYVFDVGFWANCGAVSGTEPYHSLTRTSAMWWGNWDAATWRANGNTNGVRYCTGSGVGNSECTRNETGSSDPTFPGLSSPSSNFAASLYLTTKPLWFGNVAWPAVGPDVNCTSNCVANAGNHAHKIPARVCYESTAKDGNGYLTTYDARNCYASYTASAPNPPTALAAQ